MSSIAPAAPETPVAPVVPRTHEHLALHPLGVDQVRVTGGVWHDWQRANRDVTTPHALHWLERDGAIAALRDPADADGRRSLWFSDSDVYRTMESIAWDIGVTDSPTLTASLEELTALVAAAQEEDGYLNTWVQQGFADRWADMSHNHELYCLGHLIQAAVAHYRATGSQALLGVGTRAADLLVDTFGGGRRNDADGHPEIEMALVELYRATGERTYLDLAQQLIDVRGNGATSRRGHFGPAYYQDATPVREETTVVGHAVRALYLLAGVVDVHLETGEPALLEAALRQWDSMEATKTYLTGALGSRFEGEAFGDEHELPPDISYGETCATVAAVMLAWRLLLATGHERFADAIERGLYNLVAASTALDRASFFYNNPAQRRVPQQPAPANAVSSRAEAPGTRAAWFHCSCCPPNIMRTIATLGALVATCTNSGVQLHQYLPATVVAETGGGEVTLRIETSYPLNGEIDVLVERSPNQPWALSLRVPAWSDTTTLTVGGQRVDAVADPEGRITLTRTWRPGDVVHLELDTRARLTVMHPAVDAVRGSVAIERGPLVYCLESPDQEEGVNLNRVELDVGSPLVEERVQELLGQQVVRLRAKGWVRNDAGWAGRGWAPLHKQPQAEGRAVELVAIPYYLWANRGPSVMRVFVPANAG